MQLGKALRKSTGPALPGAGPAEPGCSGSSLGEYWVSPRMEIPLLSKQPPIALDCPQFFLLFFLRTISNFPHSNLSSWPLTLSPCHQVTQVFSYRVASFHLFPSLFSCTGLFHPNCWAAHLPLSKFMTFLSAHFSIVSRSLQKAACLLSNMCSPQACRQCSLSHYTAYSYQS